MKQSFALAATVAICSVLFVLLMWAPFNYPLTASQVVKYALMGAAMGLVFYLIAIRKRTARKIARKPAPLKPMSKKAKRTKVSS